MQEMEEFPNELAMKVLCGTPGSFEEKLIQLPASSALLSLAALAHFPNLAASFSAANKTLHSSPDEE